MILVRAITIFSAIALAFQPAYAQNSREISVAVEGTQRRAIVVNDLHLAALLLS